ncbi:MAG: hypothetical protein RLZZ04_3844 [Cyanobacteriota bacterium]
MKIAVMSCIHGNYPALDAVLVDIDQQKAEKIYCLGDLVGYGPEPNAVVEQIRSLDIPTVQGCWDEDIVEGLNACDCSYPSLLAEKRGKTAHEWTNKEVHPEVREYLAQLPHTYKEDNLCFVHGSPSSNHEYLLPEMDAFTALKLEKIFDRFDTNKDGEVDYKELKTGLKEDFDKVVIRDLFKNHVRKGKSSLGIKEFIELFAPANVEVTAESLRHLQSRLK